MGNSLLKGPESMLRHKETRFWNYLIEHYLYPLQEDKDEKARISKELKKMRNQVAFVFFMLNALFVVMLLLMELHQDSLYIEYPDIGHYNISCTKEIVSGDVSWEVILNEPYSYFMYTVHCRVYS